MNRKIKEQELLLPLHVETDGKPVTVMVIGDSHSEPHYITDNLGQRILETIEITNARFDMAGKMIVDQRPDIIVEMGDFCEMESFSSYKQVPNEQAVQMDYMYGRDARQRLTAPLRELQAKQRKQKDKLYDPILIALGGNHDYERIVRFEQTFPNHAGTYSKDPSDAMGQGWIHLPYRKPVEINGVHFCHNFPSGIMNRPIAGVSPAMKIIKELGITAVAGHAHIYDFKSLPNSMAGNRMALVAGCFFEHWHDWAAQANHMYTRGIFMLYNLVDAGFTHRLFGMEEIKGAYAGKV